MSLCKRVHRRVQTRQHLIFGCSLILLMSCCSAALGIVAQDDGSNVDQAPWLQDQRKSRLPAVAYTTPREALVGIAPSEFDKLFAGTDFSLQDATLLKVLYRLPKINLQDIRRFADDNHDIPWDDLMAATELFQLKMFRFYGVALYVERIGLPPELAERFEFTHYYRVLFRDRESNRIGWVLVRTVPLQWKLDQPIAELAGWDGLLIREWDESPPASWNSTLSDDVARGVSEQLNEEVDLEPGMLLFAGARMEWYPVNADADHEVPAGWSWLAARGMDASRWNDLQQSDRRPLEPRDSECFYQALSAAAMRRPLFAWASDADELSPQPFELFEALGSPGELRGEFVRLSGNIRRITRIEVQSDYVSERLGITHYYQVDLFVRLKENQVVKMNSDKENEKGPEFRNRYPVTVCLTELPAGLEPTDDINQLASFEAAFFKLWSYPSEYMDKFDGQFRQIGPLLIGRKLEVAAAPRDQTWLTFLAGGVLALSLGGAAVGMWLIGKRSPVTETSKDKEEAAIQWLQSFEGESLDSEKTTDSATDNGADPPNSNSP